MPDARPLAISAPFPRTLDLIFTARPRPPARALRVLEADPDHIAGLDPAISPAPATSSASRGSPARRWRPCPRSAASSTSSRNLLDNMPYELLFQRGVHTVTTGAVFAEPVAELGLGLALDLARGITEADTPSAKAASSGRRGQPRRPPALGLRDRPHRLRRPRPRAPPPARGLPRPRPRLRPLAAALGPPRARRRARPSGDRPRRQRHRLRRGLGDQRQPGFLGAWPSRACAPAPPSSCSPAPAWSTSPR